MNEEAIEIARLSIWIKTAQRGKILTDLDHNIRAGNSIIDEPEIDPGAFDWWQTFPEVSGQGGFDVVVGNPPYVRAEMLTAIKPYLERRYKTYGGTADLYVYFYELGVRLLRPGGRMSYIVTNKWLKAGYAKPLRHFFTEQTWVEEIVDLGHAKQVFPDADVFPCILRVRKPTESERPREALACVIPREEFDISDLPGQVQKRGFLIPQTELSHSAWSLEPPKLKSLMQKVETGRSSLSDYLGRRMFRGVTTGANSVFIVTRSTRDRLIAEDSTAAEILKPCLKGREIKRWVPKEPENWLIFTRRGVRLEQYPSIERYLLPYRESLEPRPKEHPGSEWKGRKPGNYAWYEIQDSVDYWPAFEGPQIVHSDITWKPEFAFAAPGTYLVNTAYTWSTDDLYLLGLVNSPLMWSYMWRNAQHGKDEALRLIFSFIETIPVATPDAMIREAITSRVQQLIEIRGHQHRFAENLQQWLLMEFGVEKPGPMLNRLHEAGFESFVKEVKKRRAGKSRVSSAELQRLRKEFELVVPPLSANARKILRLEVEISGFVNAAYGLSPEEIDLNWKTSPPRMPPFQDQSPSRVEPRTL